MVACRYPSVEEHGEGQHENEQHDFGYTGNICKTQEQAFAEAASFLGFAENEAGPNPRNTRSDDISDFDEETSNIEYDIFGDSLQEPNEDHQFESEQEDQEGVEHLSQDDIRVFLENESVAAAQSCSQEVRNHHTPRIDMVFSSPDAAYAFYNEYASICGFSIVKAGNYHGKSGGVSAVTRHTFKCNKGGKVVDEEVLEKRRKQKQQRK
jgi:hypothetical protein